MTPYVTMMLAGIFVLTTVYYFVKEAKRKRADRTRAASVGNERATNQTD